MLRVFLICFLLVGCTSTQINRAISDAGQILGGNQGDAQKPLSTSDVSMGLREALIAGIGKGADRVSQENGFFNNPSIKILFPADAQKAEKRLRQMGLGNQVDKFILTLNRGAEDAAKSAKPIFLSAIKSMTIEDAWSILKGEQDAATQYLKKATGEQLKQKFAPVIDKSLDKVHATRYYSDLVNTYNKIPLVEKVNPDLTDYATNLAIEGLFSQIAVEENKIRKDPIARTTDLLKRVFGSLD